MSARVQISLVYSTTRSMTAGIARHICIPLCLFAEIFILKNIHQERIRVAPGAEEEVLVSVGGGGEVRGLVVPTQSSRQCLCQRSSVMISVCPPVQGCGTVVHAAPETPPAVVSVGTGGERAG